MAAGTATAELFLPSVFDNHMVLQAGKPVAVWGMADPGEVVVVDFAGRTVKGKADTEGKWKVHLPAMDASADGRQLTVRAGSGDKSFNDVVVGEVWHASGQSNMEWRLSAVPAGKELIARADVPAIRFYQAKLTTAATPQQDVEGKWTVSSPQTAGNYSAVAYYFARKLHGELGVPIGIVQTAWGGKPVETYTSREALLSIPEGRDKVADYDRAVAAYDPEKAKEAYEKALKQYEQQITEWNAKAPDQRKGRAPRKPQPGQSPALAAGRPATIWNGMVAPVAGYTQRGTIWYQGESNASNADQYGRLFTLMIEDWRKQWGDDFRFLWVQLANFKQPVTEPGTNEPWAVVQDHQRRCLSLPKTGMAVINDIGEANNIHPANKQDVGERLARWALADDYGKSVVKCGPLFRNHRIDGDKVVATFDQSAAGLKSRDGGALKWFEIKDSAGTWHWAQAVIQGDSVVISAEGVNPPKAARYAWASNPDGANLVNSEGLPASLFTTE